MKVLIVDDDKSTLAMLQLLLSRGGCRTTGTLHPREALELLGRQSFDWLVVDGQMEGMDGFDLARQAKLLRPELNIVMISGLYAPADIQGHPISRLFQKPVDAEALSAYLQHAH